MACGLNIQFRMKHIILLMTFSMLSIQGCAPNDSSSTPPPAAPVVINDQNSTNQPPTLTPAPEKLCHEDLLCQDRCNLAFQFTTDESIARKYAAIGGSPFLAIMQNRLTIMNHDTCMETPLSKIADFLYHPLTFEDMGQVMYGGNCVYYDGKAWLSCSK